MSDYRVIIKEDDDVVNILKELIRIKLITGTVTKEIGENYLIVRRIVRPHYLNSYWIDVRVYCATQEFTEKYNDHIRCIFINKDDLLYALNMYYLTHNSTMFDELLSKEY